MPLIVTMYPSKKILAVHSVTSTLRACDPAGGTVVVVVPAVDGSACPSSFLWACDPAGGTVVVVVPAVDGSACPSSF
ncbi:MAG: hypothetical protein OXN44_11480, partial [Acidimicrobiaceae bacterium]|nr:hypothetical protein [Acidimicrobiaceae bacterium]